VDRETLGTEVADMTESLPSTESGAVNGIANDTGRAVA
jgi:hypothetical protein